MIQLNLRQVMCIICDGNYALAVDRHDVNIYIIDAGLTQLNCSGCSFITEIPQLNLLTGGSPPINKIRYQQLKTKRKYRTMIGSIILDNTSFYDALVGIIVNY